MFVGKDSIKAVSVAPGVERKVMARGGSLMAVEVYFKKDGVGSPHAHPHEQIGCILSGSFEMTIADEKRILAQGDTYYVPASVTHGVLALEDSIILDIFTPQREDFL